MLSLVTRNKQNHEAKSPNWDKDEASTLIEYFDFVLRKFFSWAPSQLAQCAPFWLFPTFRRNVDEPPYTVCRESETVSSWVTESHVLHTRKEHTDFVGLNHIIHYQYNRQLPNNNRPTRGKDVSRWECCTIIARHTRKGRRGFVQNYSERQFTSNHNIHNT